MYISRQLRGGNRFAGGSLVTFASILVRIQAKREGGDFVLAFLNKLILCMILAGWRLQRFWFPSKRNGRVIMFWRLSTNLYCLYFSPATRGKPFCRRLSNNVCVDFGSPPSEPGGWGLCFGVFRQIYTVYDSRRLRGWNLFAGGSLVTFASILVRLQAKREGGDYVLAFFSKFILCMILAGCAGGTSLPAAL